MVTITTRDIIVRITETQACQTQMFKDFEERLKTSRDVYNVIIRAQNIEVKHAVESGHTVYLGSIDYSELHNFVDNLYLMWLEEKFEKLNNAIIDMGKKLTK